MDNLPLHGIPEMHKLLQSIGFRQVYEEYGILHLQENEYEIIPATATK